MENLYVFTASFVLIFLLFLGNYIVKKTRGKLTSTKEIEFLTQKFKLNKKNLNYNRLGILFCLVNSLIIASVGTVSSMLGMHYMFQLAIGFALLMIMIYAVYGAIGLLLKRKEDKNGKHKRNRK